MPALGSVTVNFGTGTAQKKAEKTLTATIKSYKI